MAFILGKKIGMTRVFEEDGKAVPVTLLTVGPVTVTQIKTQDKDGYEAVQVGYGVNKHLSKGLAGHLEGLPQTRTMREFAPVPAEAKRGDIIDASTFQVGDTVKVSSISRGKGFQGAVKRHGFHGMPASHGHHAVLRHVGSIGQRFPQHTLKGMRMAGRMGGTRITTRGLRVMSIDTENHIMAVKGAVPGRRGTLVEVVTL